MKEPPYPDPGPYRDDSDWSVERKAAEHAREFLDSIREEFFARGMFFIEQERLAGRGIPFSGYGPDTERLRHVWSCALDAILDELQPPIADELGNL